MDLGKSLNVAIALKGIKTKDLAEGVDTSRQQVANWKRTGAIKQASLVKICIFLEMKVSEFVALGEE